jgi:hypothetical protein
LNIVVPLLTAILGAIIAGFLRSRGDRLALLRDRRLAAADDFLATASEVFIGLSQSIEAAPRVRVPEDLGNEALLQAWADKMKGSIEGARANAHAVTRHATRIELLFGRGSPTSGAAMNLVRVLMQLTETLRAERTDMARFEEHYEAAVVALATATGLLSAQIDPSPWWEKATYPKWARPLKKAVEPSGPTESAPGQVEERTTTGR